VVIFASIKRKVAGSIPWKGQKVAVGSALKLGTMRRFDRLMFAWPNQACSGVGVAREIKIYRFLLGVKWIWIARKKSVDPGKNILGFKNPTNGW
jgi:hypothetical protein